MMGKESAATPVSQDGAMLDHFCSRTVLMFCLCSDIVMKWESWCPASHHKRIGYNFLYLRRPNYQEKNNILLTVKIYSLLYLE